MMHLAKAASILGLENFFPTDASNGLHEQFAAHMEAEGLSFGTKEEYQFRLELFQKKDAEIKFWNNQQDSYRLGHNMFSTMTEAESKKWLGLNLPIDQDIEATIFDESDNGATKDWRSAGGVNSVKNQGGCGSCWAFGATAGTEHAHWRASGSLLNLSEQQLVDCSPYDHGCNGGFHTNAWTYLRSHPQMLTSQYPYTGRAGSCRASGGSVTVSGWQSVSRGSVSQHKAALNTGVVSIALAAGNSQFQMYRSGILDSTACPTQIDHAVAMVGYGNEGGKDYWIVRNSWGSGWGDRGYIRIAAHEGAGICGCQNYSYLVATN